MTWHVACAVDAIDEDGVLGAVIAGKRLALYRVDGDYYATDDQCPHGYASLSAGWLDGSCIECPLHQGLIDVRTGQPAGAPIADPVATYKVRVVDGRIEVEIG